ncbi:hypothetical protein DFQ28_005238 [Apophysomyces sp. BC1034]|nr:hypothetical protein DFQ30_007948 [Apophysomyces sp. BC1015]KAG0176602.1 hypothetical protein DFQ29_005931 [Apophysomyces sp. BC1021]KAG0188202.1 hypothetical protein DFQ28_005238 [Apophysomyces sp. BC1034]
MTAAFCYGTLMSTDVLCRVLYGPLATPETKDHLLRAIRIRPALLRGHRRFAVKNLDYPGVIRTNLPEDTVQGILVENLTEMNVTRLDAYEGEQYERCHAQVTVLPGEDSMDCYVYIWTAGQEQLEDHDWELEDFIQRKQTGYLNGSSNFNDA